MKKRTLAFILSLVMIISVMVPGTLATDQQQLIADYYGIELCNCGAKTVYDHAPDCALRVSLSALNNPQPSEPQCDCGATGDIHAESCPLYVAPSEPTCNCGAADDNHAETCPLYKESEEPQCNCGSETDEHAEDCPLYVAPVCNCQTGDGVHLETCPCYVAPEEESVFDILMAQPDLEALYDKLFELMETNSDDLYALTADELEQLIDRTDELLAAIEEPTDLNMESYDMLMEMWNLLYVCPDCGLEGGEHEEDCPRGQMAVLVGLTVAGGTLDPGTHTLTADLTMNNNTNAYFKVYGDVTVDLNGYMISGRSATNLFRVYSGGHLTIKDSSDGTSSHTVTDRKTGNTVTIYGGVVNGNNHRGVNIDGGGQFTLQGGTIAGCKGDNGAAVWMYSRAVMTQSGGSIAYNYATSNGGAIYLQEGSSSNTKLYIDGGTISNNSADSYAGGIYSRGTIIMTSGKITENFGNGYGGGIHLGSDGKLEMSDGEISNNLGQSGGGVILYGSGSVFTMTGGTISNNETDGTGNTGNGGGVHVQNGTFNFLNGTISNNTASGYGGGINIVSSSQLVIGSETGTCYITGNNAKNSAKGGGGISSESGTMSLDYSGVIIDGNTAAGRGGGIYIKTGTLNVKAGTISNNSSPNGGGITIDKGTINITGGNITGNSTTGNGGALNVGENGTSTVRFESGTMSNNTASGNGGAINVAKGSLYIGLEACKGSGTVSGHTCPVMENNTAGGNGGGISIVGGTTTMYCGELSGNSSTSNPTSNSFYQSGGSFTIYGGNLGLGVDNDNGGSYTDNRQGVYNITFVSYYDGRVHGSVTQQANGGMLTLPGSSSLHYTAFNREGKTLYGWSETAAQLNEDYVVGKSIIFPGDATLYAIWVDDTHTITYDVGDGTLAEGSPTSYNFSFAQSSVNIPTPTSNSGKTFLGWTVSGEGNWGSGSCTTALDVTGKHGNVTLTANWGTVAYKIEYDLDGGTDPGNPVGFNSGGLPITLKDPTKPGYEFNGWLDQNNNNRNLGTNYTITRTSANYKSYKLKASWTLEEYDATLDFNGGTIESGEAVTSIKYDIEKGITLPDASKPGYSFAGWGVDRESISAGNWDANTFYKGAQTGLYGNVKLIAQWKEKDVTITYVAGDGGSVNPTSETLGQETGVALGSTAIPADGYRFVGWYKGTEQVSTDLKYVPTKADASLWPEDAVYTAVFELDVTSLTITVNGFAEIDQGLLIEVSGPEINTVVAVVGGNNSVTIQDVKVGSQYTIIPKGNWSWRYDITNTSGNNTIVLNANENLNVVTFSVTKNPNRIYWLSGESYYTN